MSKRILLGIGIILLFNIAYAGNPNFYLGAGLTFANSAIEFKSGDNVETDFIRLVSFYGGTEFPLDNLNKYAITFEASYRQMGSEITFRDPVMTEVGVLKNSYFCLSPALRARLTRGYYSFYVKGGVFLGSLIKAKMEETAVTDQFKNMDFGGDACLGVEILASQLAKLFIEIRYSHSLTDANAEMDIFNKINNRTICIQTGVKF